jgi:hypothetical protein
MQEFITGPLNYFIGVVFRLLAYLQESIHFRHLPLLACMAGSLSVSLLSNDQFESDPYGQLINILGRNAI